MSRPKLGRAGFCIPGCGACCDPVPYTATQAELRSVMPATLTEEGRLNRAWVLEHFTPIPRGVGLRATPEMTSGHTVAINPKTLETVEVWTHFYECDAFDPATRSCTAYDDRPPMCGGYPWYGVRPDPTKAIPAECGYNVDVGREPVPVEIAPRRGTRGA